MVSRNTYLGATIKGYAIYSFFGELEPANTVNQDGLVVRLTGQANNCTCGRSMFMSGRE